MIKIIKSGKKEFHVTCPSCGCEFTYETEDFNGTDYDGVNYVKCPECGTPVSHRVTCTNVYTATSTNTDVAVDTGETETGGIQFNDGKN